MACVAVVEIRQLVASNQNEANALFGNGYKTMKPQHFRPASVYIVSMMVNEEIVGGAM